MASKAAEWAVRYTEADRARDTVRDAKPWTVRLTLGPGRSVEIATGDDGRPYLTAPLAGGEAVEPTELLTFARAILATFAEAGA